MSKYTCRSLNFYSKPTKITHQSIQKLQCQRQTPQTYISSFNPRYKVSECVKQNRPQVHTREPGQYLKSKYSLYFLSIMFKCLTTIWSSKSTAKTRQGRMGNIIEERIVLLYKLFHAEIKQLTSEFKES